MTPARDPRSDGRAALDNLRAWGVEELLVPRRIAPRRTPAKSGSGKAARLASLREEIGDCRRCGLWTERTHVVFGVGDPDAEIMFVGEAPGSDEDRQGEPFVGRAGQLLTKIIEAMGLARERVYIANIIKCRPPGNRNPLPLEIGACSGFLRAQVEIISPRAIVALGTFSAQTLLGTDEKISRLRGRFHPFHGIPLMPTYHPAYLLRNPNEKKQVWEDVQKVMALLSGREPA
ncbi:MAG: uracil-DNA glycosylase [Nitrospirae bacterium]|nr:uracil-DNA glycosylase [Nitrospirota bacterium]